MGKLLNYKDFNEKKSNFNVIRINNKDDFDEFYSGLERDSDSIWRGSCESKYMLYTSLQRFWIEKNLPNDLDHLIGYIDHIIEYGKAWKKGFILNYLKNYGIKDVGVFAILSYLRHHETPTPILDWTRNSKVGLFFATYYSNLFPSDDTIDNYFSLYELKATHPFHLYDYKKVTHEGLLTREESLRNTNKVTQEEDPDFIKKFTEAFLSDKPQFFNAVKTYGVFKLEDFPEDEFKLYINNNYNITNQEGIFLVNSDITEPLETSINVRSKKLAAKNGNISNEHIERKLKDHKENFISYDIHKNLKDYILHRLEGEGISLSFIYPNPKELARECVQSFMIKN